MVEEVFGDIQDETDMEIEPIRSDGEGAYLLQPGVRIEEMLDVFHLSFEQIGLDQNEWEGETLGYFIISYFERLPVKGDEIELQITDDPEKEENADKKLLSLRIMSVKNNQIGDVKVMIKDF